jgi:hypothetical protein
MCLFFQSTPEEVEMADQVQTMHDNLKAAVIVAVAIYAAVCLFELLGQHSAWGVIPGALAALTYWLVFSKLTTEITAAKNMAIGLACVSAIDIALGFMAMSSPYGSHQAVLLVMLGDFGVIGCLGYVASQLLQVENSGARSGPALGMPSALTGAPAAPDVLEQLMKLGELHDAGVLSNAEFEAKKAELLKRI